jgi:hypothetical protein
MQQAGTCVTEVVEYEKRAVNYRAMVIIAALVIWVTA